jgi:N-acetylglutamate synthase-like GNAT family acetyltransferase
MKTNAKKISNRNKNATPKIWASLVSLRMGGDRNHNHLRQIVEGVHAMSEKIQIRRARPEEAPALTELTMRSKSYWRYDADFLAEARGDLELRPEKFLPDFHVYVLEADNELAGFCSLISRGPDHIELEDLFVEPRRIGKGYGKQLWDFSVNLARELGFRTVVLTADPNAESFYVRQGAVRIGEKTSPVRPDRRLPVMEYRIGS